MPVALPAPRFSSRALQGSAVVEVEERTSAAEGYGKGTPKLRMSFAECLRRMGAGDTSLYLTTQKVRLRACARTAAALAGRMGLPLWACLPARGLALPRRGIACRLAPRSGPARHSLSLQVATGEDGHPEVLSQPLSDLAADFPVQPALLGNLVPQQVNLWAGCAPEGGWACGGWRGGCVWLTTSCHVALLAHLHGVYTARSGPAAAPEPHS